MSGDIVPVQALGNLSVKQSESIGMLAEGLSIPEVAKELDISPATIRRWKSQPEFRHFLDREMMHAGVSSKAERLRIAHMAVRQAMNEQTGVITTKTDIHEWLKYIAQETGQWYSNAEVASLQKKLKMYEKLLYLLQFETCDTCKLLVIRRMQDDVAPAEEYNADAQTQEIA